MTHTKRAFRLNFGHAAVLHQQENVSKRTAPYGRRHQVQSNSHPLGPHILAALAVHAEDVDRSP